MDNLPVSIVPSENSLTLPPEFLQNLQTPQDFENAFSMISESKNRMIWYEADIILLYYQKFLGQHLDIYRAGQLMNNSTVKYYLRTASGFDPDKRLPNLSFNHFYTASFADEWDSKTLRFKGDKRFVYLEKASDEQLSTRRLKEIIDLEKEQQAKKIDESVCMFCKVANDLFSYIIYERGKKNLPISLKLHPECFNAWLTTLPAYGKS